MKLTGCLLILWAAGQGCLSARKRMLEPLRLAQALAEDLAVLKSLACTGQFSLLRILEQDLAGGFGGAKLWLPLSRALKTAPAPSLPRLWQHYTAALPQPLDKFLSPLGSLLGAGGKELAVAINETREELAGFIRTERQTQAAKQKLSTAMWFSAAMLMILVLI